MTIGEILMHESTLRLQSLRQSPGRPGRLLKAFLHWAAWLNYLVSVIVLAAGITAGWRFAETGFELMMKNVSGEEIRQTVIKKIPAWIFVHKGIKDW
jgi:hypothetical protein